MSMSKYSNTNEAVWFCESWWWSYGNSIYNYLYNQCLSQLKLRDFESRWWRCVLDAILDDEVCHW